MKIKKVLTTLAFSLLLPLLSASQTFTSIRQISSVTLTTDSLNVYVFPGKWSIASSFETDTLFQLAYCTITDSFSNCSAWSLNVSQAYASAADSLYEYEFSSFYFPSCATQSITSFYFQNTPFVGYRNRTGPIAYIRVGISSPGYPVATGRKYSITINRYLITPVFRGLPVHYAPVTYLLRSN